MSKLTAKQIAPFLIFAAVAVAALFIKPDVVLGSHEQYNGADIAWILVATALVFLMTPGLAFFYGETDTLSNGSYYKTRSDNRKHHLKQSEQAKRN